MPDGGFVEADSVEADLQERPNPVEADLQERPNPVEADL
jgi:hypothetical protein